MQRFLPFSECGSNPGAIQNFASRSRKEGLSLLMTSRGNRGSSLFSIMFVAAVLSGSYGHAQIIQVDITPSHVKNSIIPNQALGAGIDRIRQTTIDATFNTETIDKILEAGWGPVTYRQNTELYIEAWHWNPKGQWSDPSGKGYFV